MEQTKFLLDESQLPRRWYNVAADMPNQSQPVLHPGTGEPVGTDQWYSTRQWVEDYKERRYKRV